MYEKFLSPFMSSGIKSARRRNTQCRVIARHLYSVARREILTKRTVGNDLHFLRRKIWISGTVISNDNTKSVFLHFVGSNITDRLISISTTLPKTPKNIYKQITINKQQFYINKSINIKSK